MSGWTAINKPAKARTPSTSPEVSIMEGYRTGNPFTPIDAQQSTTTLPLSPQKASSSAICTSRHPTTDRPLIPEPSNQPQASIVPIDAHNDDDSEHLWCSCRQISSGSMIRCGNAKCTIKWYHMHCLGMTEAPEDLNWNCFNCHKDVESQEKCYRAASSGVKKQPGTGTVFPNSSPASTTAISAPSKLAYGHCKSKGDLQQNCLTRLEDHPHDGSEPEWQLSPQPIPTPQPKKKAEKGIAVVNKSNSRASKAGVFASQAKLRGGKHTVSEPGESAYFDLGSSIKRVRQKPPELSPLHQPVVKTRKEDVARLTKTSYPKELTVQEQTATKGDVVLDEQYLNISSESEDNIEDLDNDESTQQPEHVPDFFADGDDSDIKMVDSDDLQTSSHTCKQGVRAFASGQSIQSSTEEEVIVNKVKDHVSDSEDEDDDITMYDASASEQSRGTAPVAHITPTSNSREIPDSQASISLELDDSPCSPANNKTALSYASSSPFRPLLEEVDKRRVDTREIADSEDEKMVDVEQTAKMAQQSMNDPELSNDQTTQLEHFSVSRLRDLELEASISSTTMLTKRQPAQKIKTIAMGERTTVNRETAVPDSRNRSQVSQSRSNKRSRTEGLENPSQLSSRQRHSQGYFYVDGQLRSIPDHYQIDLAGRTSDHLDFMRHDGDSFEGELDDAVRRGIITSYHHNADALQPHSTTPEPHPLSFTHQMSGSSASSAPTNARKRTMLPIVTLLAGPQRVSTSQTHIESKVDYFVFNPEFLHRQRNLRARNARAQRMANTEVENAEREVQEKRRRFFDARVTNPIKFVEEEFTPRPAGEREETPQAKVRYDAVGKAWEELSSDAEDEVDEVTAKPERRWDAAQEKVMRQSQSCDLGDGVILRREGDRLVRDSGIRDSLRLDHQHRTVTSLLPPPAQGQLNVNDANVDPAVLQAARGLVAMRHSTPSSSQPPVSAHETAS